MSSRIHHTTKPDAPKVVRVPPTAIPQLRETHLAYTVALAAWNAAVALSAGFLGLDAAQIASIELLDPKTLGVVTLRAQPAPTEPTPIRPVDADPAASEAT